MSGPEPVPLDEFVWPELETSGLTATAKALRLLAGELTIERMPRRGLPPSASLSPTGSAPTPARNTIMPSPNSGRSRGASRRSGSRLPSATNGLQRARTAQVHQPGIGRPPQGAFPRGTGGIHQVGLGQRIGSIVPWPEPGDNGSRGDLEVSLESPPQMITSNTDLF